MPTRLAQYMLVAFVIVTAAGQNTLLPSVTSFSKYIESQTEANLTCTLRTAAIATNHHFPLFWNRAGGLPSDASSRSSQQPGSGGGIIYKSVLYFTPTASDNEVIISCNATIGNLVGSDSYLPLVVLVPDEPVITGPDAVRANEIHTWTCKSDGSSRSAPNVYWSDDNDVVLMDEVTESTTVKFVPNKNKMFVVETTITLSLPTEGSFNLTCSVEHSIFQDSYSIKKIASQSLFVYY